MALRTIGGRTRFITIVRRARFVYSPFTGSEMQQFGQLLADTIRARIQAGQNVYDQAAAPLKPAKAGRRGYPDAKAARGLKPIRDWTWSGHTLRCLKVLTANENRAVLAFLQETKPGRGQTAAQIASTNNRREWQWGASPRDRASIVLVMLHYRPIVTLEDLKQGAYFRGMRQVEANQYFGSLNTRVA